MTVLRHLHALSRRPGFVAIVLATSVWLTLSAQSNQLRLVSTEWPPFTATPGHSRVALDLVEAGLSRIGFSATTTIVDPGAFADALVSDRFDGSAAAWKDAERERTLVFSEAYLENRLILVGRKGADVSAKTFAALRGKRIAIVGGYAYGPAVENAGPIFVRTTSEQDSLTHLLDGRADYTVMDELVVDSILTNYAGEARTKLQIGSTAILKRPLYLALNRSRPDAEAIIGRFNRQLLGMIADHTYHHLLNVDWISVDVNNDGVPEYVPSTDHPKSAAPPRVYSVALSDEKTTGPAALDPKPNGFYLGGNIYRDWASVPDSFKRGSADPPDPRSSEASIFRFVW